jgi:AbrB family looped-hinge helix DNA binding protein
MATVTVSPKYQIVIPKELRERLDLQPGQKLFMYEVEGSLYLDLPKPIQELRGLARGLRWEESDRDRTERF